MSDTQKVYSSRLGRLCPTCEKPIADCHCKASKPMPTGDGIVRVRKELKGRNGKPMITIAGLLLSENELQAIAKTLKQKFATGGSVKNGIIEIQGDKRDEIVVELKKKGFTVKISGG